ncbi:MAG: hypothetical protein PVF51_09990 [Nitrospirota bacterium]|jgi:hypothetical protein
MDLHPYARIALGILLVVLSATVILAPSASKKESATPTVVTAPAEAKSPVASDDRSEAIKILRRG